jgi:hypothetical protein
MTPPERAMGDLPMPSIGDDAPEYERATKMIVAMLSSQWPPFDDETTDEEYMTRLRCLFEAKHGKATVFLLNKDTLIISTLHQLASDMLAVPQDAVVKYDSITIPCDVIKSSFEVFQLQQSKASKLAADLGWWRVIMQCAESKYYINTI